MLADFLQHVVTVPNPQPVISGDEMFNCALIFDKMHPSAELQSAITLANQWQQIWAEDIS